MNPFNKVVVGISPSSVAMFQGVFASVIGLGVAILWSISGTVGVADSTGSVLAGLAFGLTAGAVAIIVLPLIYFGFGWLVGLVQGFVINFVLEGSGGLNLVVKDTVKKNGKR
jgi:hypothetical protein